MTLVRVVLASVVLFLVLIQPNHPQAMTWGALRLFPLELPVIVAALVLLGRGALGYGFRAALVGALGVIVLLKLADFGTFIAFNRGFNLLVDLGLVHAGWTLLQGSIGLPAATLAAGGALVAFAALIAALWWATGVWAALPVPRLARVGAAILLVPAAAAAIAEIGQARRAWSLPETVRAALPGAAFTARVGIERIEQFRDTVRIVVEEPIPDMRIGMSATAQLVLAERNDVLVLPSRAVQRYATRRYVHVLADGVRVERDVEVGLETPTEVEIVRGLEEGEEVVLR